MNKAGLQNLFNKVFKKSTLDTELKATRALSAQDPVDMRLKLKIGELYVRKKDLATAIPIFAEVAEAYEKEDFLLKAIAIYKNILKVSPGSVEFNEKLGDLYQKMGMGDDAAQQYQIVIQFYRNRRNFDEALKACRKLVEAQPEQVQHRLRIAELYFNQGMQEDSMAEYEKIARDLRKEMKHVDVLAEVYEKILLKKPQETGLLLELCVFYLKLGKPQKAIAKIEKNHLEQDEKFKPVYEKALELRAHLTPSPDSAIQR